MHQWACQLNTCLLPKRRVCVLNARNCVVHVRGGSLASGFCIASFNGTHNHGMFLTNLAGKVSTSGLIGTCHACGTLQKLSQVLQRSNQERVARGFGNSAVKIHVLINTITPGKHGLVQPGNRLANALDIDLGATLCGQCGNLGFQGAANI